MIFTQTTFTEQIHYKELTITPESIGISMGYEPGTVPDYVIEMLTEELDRLVGYTDIQIGFRILEKEKVNFSSKGFTFDNIHFDTGKIIANQIRDASTLTVFLVSAGSDFDKRSKEAADNGNLLLSYCIETTGSELAEASADLLEQRLNNFIHECNFTATNRFSPGYCSWDVSEQHKLFKLYPEGFCNVTLLPSALMIPRKSVSGIIGIGPGLIREPYKCFLCNSVNCVKRKKQAVEI